MDIQFDVFISICSSDTYNYLAVFRDVPRRIVYIKTICVFNINKSQYPRDQYEYSNREQRISGNIDYTQVLPL